MCLPRETHPRLSFLEISYKEYDVIARSSIFDRQVSPSFDSTSHSFVRNNLALSVRKVDNMVDTMLKASKQGDRGKRRATEDSPIGQGNSLA